MTTSGRAVQGTLSCAIVKELDFDDDAPVEIRCPDCGEPSDVDIDPGAPTSRLRAGLARARAREREEE
jgi:hypothetical protein